MFSGATLRELDASAYEEAPPLSPEEIAEELAAPVREVRALDPQVAALAARDAALVGLHLSCQAFFIRSCQCSSVKFGLTSCFPTIR